MNPTGTLRTGAWQSLVTSSHTHLAVKLCQLQGTLRFAIASYVLRDCRVWVRAACGATWAKHRNGTRLQRQARSKSPVGLQTTAQKGPTQITTFRTSPDARLARPGEAWRSIFERRGCQRFQTGSRLTPCLLHLLCLLCLLRLVGFLAWSQLSQRLSAAQAGLLLHALMANSRGPFRQWRGLLLNWKAASSRCPKLELLMGVDSSARVLCCNVLYCHCVPLFFRASSIEIHLREQTNVAAKGTLCQE